MKENLYFFSEYFCKSFKNIYRINRNACACALKLNQNYSHNLISQLINLKLIIVLFRKNKYCKKQTKNRKNRLGKLKKIAWGKIKVI